AAVLDRQPGESGPVPRADDGACVLAGVAAHSARGLPALDRELANLLDVRGHTIANRPWLRRSVPARLPARARSVDRVRAVAGRLLGRIRAVSAVGTGLRLRQSGRAEGVAASDERVRGALEQEQQP